MAPLPRPREVETKPMTILSTRSPDARDSGLDLGESTWQKELKTAVRDLETLARLVELPCEDLIADGGASRDFPLVVPRHYVARMRPGRRHDPLLLQVLPQAVEMVHVDSFTRDPVGEQAAQVMPGLLHKYAGRALLVLTGTCAVHCRYCFRRHFPYDAGPAAADAWDAPVAAITDDASIREVILSGGDPFTLTDSRLQRWVERIAAIPHVQRLRVHTRLPIVIPSRVTDALLRTLSAARPAVMVVVHANHAQEIDTDVADALGRFVDTGIPVLNQAVLLRGVNDTVTAQHDLCETLVNHRVIPYYLHQLDRVAGGAHFETPPEHGVQIIAELRARLPGYAVPRFVVETPGEPAKTVLA